MSAETDHGAGEPDEVERRLLTRVAELEAELVEQHAAADAARALLSQVAAEQDGLRRRIEELECEITRLASLRGSIGSMQRALARRLRG